MKPDDAKPTLIRRVLRAIIGPWGLHPLFVGGIFLIFFSVASTEGQWFESAADGGGFLLMMRNVPSTLISSGIIVIVMAASLWLLQKRGRSEPSLLWYWLTLIIAALPIALYRMHLAGFPIEEMSSHIDITVRTWMRLTAGLLIVSNIVGITLHRLRRQVLVTESAYALIEEQRTIILTTEEKSRRSVADFLHDHVQASLVVIAMQLKELQGRLPSQESATVGSLIENLDSLRSDEVRMASRRLSPEIEVAGLTSSLRDLAAGYAPAMKTDVYCPAEVDSVLRGRGKGRDLALGLYRIVEQCLLNAVGHGNARECMVEITCQPDDIIELRVVDNGRGLSSEEQPTGRGTAVISGWVSVLAGTWTRRNVDAGGVEVNVRVPFVSDSSR